MNRLSILLLIYFLSVSASNAAKVDTADVSTGFSGISAYVLDISDAETEVTTLSKLTAENDAVPPTSWIVGLGLCLVFLGYKMKTRTSKIK
jgi:hypothetical protein